jgi:hypothetical protein
MSTVEFDGPPRQVEPLTVEELQPSPPPVLAAMFASSPRFRW